MLEPRFEVDERREDGWVRLILRGELDMAAAPKLEARLHELSAKNCGVRVDLSEVEFMDSAGLRVFLDAANHAHRSGWQLEVLSDVSPQVRRLFRLVEVEDLILADQDGVAPKG